MRMTVEGSPQVNNLPLTQVGLQLVIKTVFVFIFYFKEYVIDSSLAEISQNQIGVLKN